MKEEIQRLKDLQEVDLKIGEIERAMAAGKDKLESRKESIGKQKAEIAEFQARLAEGEARRRELEAEVEDVQLMIKDRQNKLMKVQTNREYQSILKEIDDAKSANRQRDDELVRLLEQSEYLQKKIDDQAALCAEEEAHYNDDSAQLEKAAADLEVRMAKLQKTRVAKVKKVKAALLRKYEQIREKRGGVAMVGVNRGVCHGCFMNVPPQLYNELLREDRLHACPTCNRLLYNLPDPEESA
ncbi:MAG: C4-type zinc ribbon domain-containing protein [Desulfurivibrionaceae bacterium]|nr:C4-type zinc ribbon domain-containing protein [Desulfobulbales bacterium]MDT8334329.1 C4-type zinc ribbon domain-containing protein [Desulfurivibrionaceae bacterium]